MSSLTTTTFFGGFFLFISMARKSMPPSTVKSKRELLFLRPWALGMTALCAPHP